ncbi:hypothetical protein [Aeromonas hydrophila]|uniref:hypothetical protein n=1 Tax=Aeromonas hydrophila TaxID=644 RepID=UPI003EC76E68
MSGGLVLQVAPGCCEFGAEGGDRWRGGSGAVSGGSVHQVAPGCCSWGTLVRPSYRGVWQACAL